MCEKSLKKAKKQVLKVWCSGFYFPVKIFAGPDTADSESVPTGRKERKAIGHLFLQNVPPAQGQEKGVSSAD
jgi:hypothetical protein